MGHGDLEFYPKVHSLAGNNISSDNNPKQPP
jgi:hypothetical protein